MMILQLTNFIGTMMMTDSFMQNHQSALDNQREDDAIQYLEDTGVYPNPDDKLFPMETEDDLDNCQLF